MQITLPHIMRVHSALPIMQLLMMPSSALQIPAVCCCSWQHCRRSALAARFQVVCSCMPYAVTLLSCFIVSVVEGRAVECFYKPISKTSVQRVCTMHASGVLHNPLLLAHWGPDAHASAWQTPIAPIAKMRC